MCHEYICECAKTIIKISACADAVFHTNARPYYCCQNIFSTVSETKTFIGLQKVFKFFLHILNRKQKQILKII